MVDSVFLPASFVVVLLSNLPASDSLLVPTQSQPIGLAKPAKSERQSGPALLFEKNACSASCGHFSF